MGLIIIIIMVCAPYVLPSPLELTEGSMSSLNVMKEQIADEMLH